MLRVMINIHTYPSTECCSRNRKIQKVQKNVGERCGFSQIIPPGILMIIPPTPGLPIAQVASYSRLMQVKIKADEDAFASRRHRCRS